ncbi:hypothetical protein CEXT_266411 [Caerostris extrusa]|uniref:Uncharacterized protein n=1 Tax=Caerostris extrusa TaxID=172846 RepID=A0AAV4S5L8_CAEEX|nr:hypothetical protein CEXT_266411 [Caerostris extrusa]
MSPLLELPRIQENSTNLAEKDFCVSRMTITLLSSTRPHECIHLYIAEPVYGWIWNSLCAMNCTREDSSNVWFGEILVRVPDKPTPNLFQTSWYFYFFLVF